MIHPPSAPARLRHRLLRTLAPLGALALLVTLIPLALSGNSNVPGDLPKFPNPNPDYWINSKPLQPEDLKGRVVLVEVWTSV